jgi:hypothetical protein
MRPFRPVLFLVLVSALTGLSGCFMDRDRGRDDSSASRDDRRERDRQEDRAERRERRDERRSPGGGY